jgi:uncharacterized membrane protein (DUF441 family)
VATEATGEVVVAGVAGAVVDAGGFVLISANTVVTTLESVGVEETGAAAVVVAVEAAGTVVAAGVAGAAVTAVAAGAVVSL